MAQQGNPDRQVSVLGGGLAGLAAGMQAQGSVFEACDRVGGVAASDTVSGFTFDRGIHVLQTRNQRMIDLLDEVGVELRTLERRAYVYTHGKYTPYPFQVNTATLPLGLRLRCVLDFLRRDKNPEPTNYEEWMYRNVGKGFAKTFLIPYSEKFWGISPAEMTYEWTGSRVPKPSTLQVLRGAVWNRTTKIGNNATFRYPAGNGGYGTVARALSRKVADLRLDHRATSLCLKEKCIRFESGVEHRYDVLVNTIPLPTLIDIIEDAIPTEVRQAASCLRTNSIMVVNLGIDRPNISDRHWLHFPEKDVSFFRLSYPHNFDPTVTPEGMSSISAEVAYSGETPSQPEAIVDRAIDDLVRVGAMKKNEPIVVKTTQDIPKAYCIYDKQRKKAVQAISAWLLENHVITAGRYGLWSYFWSDESIMSGINAGEKARKRLELTPSESAVETTANEPQRRAVSR